MNILNSGALALMTSIGYRTGLFDVMAGLPPSTSEFYAKRTWANFPVRSCIGVLVGLPVQLATRDIVRQEADGVGQALSLSYPQSIRRYLLIALINYAA